MQRWTQSVAASYILATAPLRSVKVAQSPSVTINSIELDRRKLVSERLVVLGLAASCHGAEVKWHFKSVCSVILSDWSTFLYGVPIFLAGTELQNRSTDPKKTGIRQRL